MRNLLRFFVRYHAFFLFLVLETLCLYLLQQNNRYQQVKIVNATNTVVGGIYNSANAVQTYFRLTAVNDSLLAEAAKLRSGHMPAAGDLHITNGDTLVEPHFTYLPARVLNASIRYQQNYLLLDRGSRDGVNRGMGVISHGGLVGKVVDVSERYAKVMPVLHMKYRAAVMLQKSGVRGTLRWDGRSPRVAAMDYVVQPADLSVGDTIVTSGGSTFLPEGIMVGTISEFARKPGENFYAISVELSTDFNSLRYAYVVVDLHRNELETLMQEPDE